MQTATVYPKKYAHGFCFAVLCCGYTLTDFPISIRLTSLALWQLNDCPSASKATLMNMDKYFMWIHYERLHNHNKAKHNKTVCIFLGIYCTCGIACLLFQLRSKFCSCRGVSVLSCPPVPVWRDIVPDTTSRLIGTVVNYTCAGKQEMEHQPGVTWAFTTCNATGFWEPAFGTCVSEYRKISNIRAPNPKT